MATRAAAVAASAAARRASVAFPKALAGATGGAPAVASATSSLRAAAVVTCPAAARALRSSPVVAAEAAPPPPRGAAATGGEDGGASAKSMFTSSTMRVADVLALKGEVFYHTTADALVYDAIVEMVKHNIGSLVVVEPATSGNGLKPVGILTERDYLDKVVILGRSSRTTKVSAIMSEKALVAVTGETTLGDCMDLMVANRVRHIPVVEGGLLKGLISIGDVVKELVDSHKRNAESMSEYIQGGW